MEENGTPNGETATIEQVKNDAQVDATKLAQELAEFRKKAEQAEMRARQLENEKAAREKADEEAHQKQLEEQNEYKTLYERERQLREEIEKETESKEKQKALESAKTQILSEYPKEVIELAELTGIDMYDDSDTSKEAMKSKLDAIQEKLNIEPAKKVIGNNIQVNTNTSTNDDMILNQLRYGDRDDSSNARITAVNKISALDEMRKMAGYSK